MRLNNYGLKKVVFYYNNENKASIAQGSTLPLALQSYGNFTDAEIIKVLTKDVVDSLEKIELILINPKGHTLALLYKKQKVLWGMPWVLVERPLKLYHYHIDKRSGFFLAYCRLEVLTRLEHSFIFNNNPEINQVPMEFSNGSINIVAKGQNPEDT